jgi:hypothetical protein
MRTLTILIFGLIFSLSGCEKDATPDKAICKPENRPRQDEMDSPKTEDERLVGRWYLTDVKEMGKETVLSVDTFDFFQVPDNPVPEYPKYGPQIHFKSLTKANPAIGVVNSCTGSGKYEIVWSNNQQWIDFGTIRTFCTRVGGYGEFENRYREALNNTTCYEIRSNTLVIEYFIKADKKGKLIYEKKEG